MRTPFFRFLFFSLAVADIQLVWSQPSSLRFEHYTSREGLSATPITALYQDSRGLLWAGTDDGINYFDGTRFVSLYPSGFDAHLSSDGVSKISETADHNILMRTHDGIVLYDWSRKQMHMVINDSGKDLLHHINDFMVDWQNNIWTISSAELVKYDQQFNFTKSYPLEWLQDKIETHSAFVTNFFFSDHQNNIWFYYKGLMNVLDAASGKIYNRFQPQQYAELFSLTFNEIRLSNNGDFWFASHDSVFQYHTSGHSITFYKANVAAQLSVQLISSSGLIWLNSYYQGLYVLNPSAKNFSHFTHDPVDPYSISENSFNCIVEDKDDNVWIGSDAGLDKYNGASAKFHVKDDFGVIATDNAVQKVIPVSFTISPSKILLSSNDGIFRIDKNDFSHECYRSHRTNSILLDNFWDGLMLNNHELLASRWPGLVIFDLDKKEFSPTPFSIPHPKLLDEQPVASIFQDSRNNVWFGMYLDFGMVRWNRTDNTFIHYSQYENGKQYFPLRHFSYAAEDDSGNIWMGYDKGGIEMFNVRTQSFTAIPVAPTEPLNKDVIHSILNDHQGNLWITTSRGLIKYSLARNSYIRYTRNEGLLSNILYELTFDNKHRLWIGGNGGLCCFDLKQNHFYNYTQSDGLPEDPVTRIRFDSARNKMYCLTPTTFVYFNPDELKKNSLKLNPIVTALSVNGNERPLNTDGTIELSPIENSLSFQFIAPNLVNASDNQYEYKLNGFDKNWQQAGDRNFAAYTNLPGGTYTFQVRASTDGITWFEAKNILSLHVSIPFYRTSLFIISVLLFIVLLTILIVYIYYRVQLQRLLYAQKIRNKIASDLHDDVGSSLSSISWYSEIAKQEVQKNFSEATAYFDKIGDNARQIIDDMNDIVWAVNPRNDSIELIVQRMEEFATGILSARNMELKFEADDSLSAVKLSMEKRRNFYLIYKEAINNIVKYSGCKNVTVTIHSNDGMISMLITDDGKGFDTSQHYVGNGLHNFKKRAEEMNGRIGIDSVVGKGTSIQLQFKTT